MRVQGRVRFREGAATTIIDLHFGGKLKRQLVAVTAALLLAGLASCSNGATQTAEGSLTPTPAVSTAKPAKTVPNVAGKTFAEANSAIKSAGFSFAEAVGPDGKAWIGPNTGY